jgi:hypothetical protein
MPTKRTPRQFTELVQRLMRADPITRFLDGEISKPEPSSEQPAASPPPGDTQKPEPPAQKRRKKSGPAPTYDQASLLQLDEGQSEEALRGAYQDKHKIDPSSGKPSLTWVRTHRRPR